MFPILASMAICYVVALTLTWTGVFAEGTPEAVTFVGVGDTEFVRGLTVGGGGLLWPWGTPLFDWSLLIGILAAFLASMVESFGDYHAISQIVTGADPEPRTIDRGIGAEGVGSFATGLFGGFSSTSYSGNIALVRLTKVGSRYVVGVAAAVLVAMGFVGKLGAAIATIPRPIVGGAYLVLFGLIAAVGLSILRRADLDSQRNLLIVGFVLFSGLVFPSYFASAEDFSAFGMEWLTEIIVAIGSSGIATAAVLGLLLDNLIPGTATERGLPRE
jgi:xanthine/uracil permease